MVYNQLYEYLLENNLLTKHQSGFRPLHSTVTALLDVTNDWYINMDKGMTNMVVFLDLAKAFDTVSHSILLRKLELYGVRGTSLNWFTSYVSNRQQQCIVGSSTSQSERVWCGVPQGSILGPLLFLLYINDLPTCLLHTKPHMYADDTILSAASTSTSELENKLNNDLFSVRKWLLANKLSLNVAKTEYMLIGSHFRLSNLGKPHSIVIGDKKITRVKHTAYLGVHLDESLKWDEHINQLCSKISRAISGLRQARDFVSTDVLKMIYNALIQPHFDYCDAVWGNLSSGLAARSQRLQNRAARIITAQGYDVRSAHILNELNWDVLATRRDKRLSLLMYDAINHNVPEYISELFPPMSTSNPYKTRLRESSLKIDITHIPKTDHYKNSFSYRGATHWNSLPVDMKSSVSKANLKRKLSRGCQTAV